MAKHTYSVTCEGRTFTRTTERTYTHLVLVRKSKDSPWCVYGWCGRLDLANKQHQTAAKSLPFVKTLDLVQPEAPTRIKLTSVSKEKAKAPTLVYKGTRKPVQVGDVVTTRSGQATVTYFREPHKPASEGKVSIREFGSRNDREYYVSVIGAEWINRTDR